MNGGNEPIIDHIDDTYMNSGFVGLSGFYTRFYADDFLLHTP